MAKKSQRVQVQDSNELNFESAGGSDQESPKNILFSEMTHYLRIVSIVLVLLGPDCQDSTITKAFESGWS